MKSERHLPTEDASVRVLTISCVLVAGRPVAPICVRISDGSQVAPRAPRIFRAGRKEDYSR